MSQQQMQQQEERYEFTASVLREATVRPLTSAEILFLASELGLSARDLVQHTSEKEMKHATNW